MKLDFLKLAIIIVVLSFTACKNGTGQTVLSGNVDLNNELDSVSYSLGVDIGESLKSSNVDNINMELFMSGLSHALKGDSVQINQKEAQMLIRTYFQKVRFAKMQKNLEEGRKWLKKNAENEGVVTTESGLQYKVIKKGNGPLPVDTDVVKVHYKGTLVDGTPFDSSYERGEPFETKVAGRIIKGWTEALKLMPVGSKYIFYIPTELAYGQNVRPGGVIKPNVPLIFEMELLEIVSPADNTNK